MIELLFIIAISTAAVTWFINASGPEQLVAFSRCRK